MQALITHGCLFFVGLPLNLRNLTFLIIQTVEMNLIRYL
jgi:hypothetical protein